MVVLQDACEKKKFHEMPVVKKVFTTYLKVTTNNS